MISEDMRLIKLIDLGTAIKFDDSSVAKRKRIGTVIFFVIFKVLLYRPISIETII